MNLSRRAFLTSGIGLAACVPRWAAAEVTITTQQVILKCDDFPAPSATVAGRWKQWLDMLAARGVPCAVGYIGAWAESVNAAWPTWDPSLVEVFCHGYTHGYDAATGVYEFQGSGLDAQMASLRNSINSATARLGVAVQTFGAPYNRADDCTRLALVGIPELRAWLYPGTGVVAPAGVTGLYRGGGDIEVSTGVPSLAKLQSTRDPNRPLLVLQCHPGSFRTAADQAQAAACVDWLIAEGCTFTTPAAYVGV